jgi:hypothetical protein
LRFRASIQTLHADYTPARKENTKEKPEELHPPQLFNAATHQAPGFRQRSYGERRLKPGARSQKLNPTNY